MAETMRAVRFYPPGSYDKLLHETCAIPKDLRSNQILVKVCGVGVMWEELFWPIHQDRQGGYHPHILGRDFSGTVVAMGPEAAADSDIRVGSEVFAFTAEFNEEIRDGTGQWKYEGAIAEYAVADTTTATVKPKNMSLIEAASVPLSALTAWQALHDHGHVQEGQKVVVMGAAGATGLWAVQMAGLVGAHVIGTASSAQSGELLASAGVAQIIDYKQQRLEELVSDVDLVLDFVGRDEISEQAAKILKKDGKFISICNDKFKERLKDDRGHFFIVTGRRDQLLHIRDLIEQGKLRTFIEEIFPMADAVEAFKRGATGHAHGRIVIKVAD